MYSKIKKSSKVQYVQCNTVKGSDPNSREGGQVNEGFVIEIIQFGGFTIETSLPCSFSLSVFVSLKVSNEIQLLHQTKVSLWYQTTRTNSNIYNQILIRAQSRGTVEKLEKQQPWRIKVVGVGAKGVGPIQKQE